jgi:uncharacterized membrane-anchored protein YhcB (DUF1043 family)
VYSLEIIITVSLAAVVFGLLIGFFLAHRTAPSQRSQRQLETRLHELMQQQQDYQHEVSEHFIETGVLLDQLTSSYRDVHNHLAQGAQRLASEQASLSIKSLPDEHGINSLQPPLDENISPPLDYAPKIAPGVPGMLNEEFGLDKSRQTDELDIPVTSHRRK